MADLPYLTADRWSLKGRDVLSLSLPRADVERLGLEAGDVLRVQLGPSTHFFEILVSYRGRTAEFNCRRQREGVSSGQARASVSLNSRLR